MYWNLEFCLFCYKRGAALSLLKTDSLIGEDELSLRYLMTLVQGPGHLHPCKTLCTVVSVPLCTWQDTVLETVYWHQFLKKKKKEKKWIQKYYELIPGIRDETMTMTVDAVLERRFEKHEHWGIKANAPHMRSPELGSGAGSWRSTAAALLRFDALPLHGDAREVINKARSFRNAG